MGPPASVVALCQGQAVAPQLVISIKPPLVISVNPTHQALRLQHGAGHRMMVILW